MSAIVWRLHGRFYLIPLLLLTTDAFLSLFESFTGNGVRGRFSFFSFGIIAGWISFVTGMLALYNVRKNELAAGLCIIHGFISGMALLVWSAFWSNDWKSYPSPAVAKLPVALIKWLLLAMLAAGVALGKKAARKLLRH